MTSQTVPTEPPPLYSRFPDPASTQSTVTHTNTPSPDSTIASATAASATTPRARRRRPRKLVWAPYAATVYIGSSSCWEKDKFSWNTETNCWISNDRREFGSLDDYIAMRLERSRGRRGMWWLEILVVSKTNEKRIVTSRRGSSFEAANRVSESVMEALRDGDAVDLRLE